MFKGNMVQRYSLRKYAVGLCSALLGLFLIGSPSVVKGDEVDSESVASVTESLTLHSDPVSKVDASPQQEQIVNAESVSKEQLTSVQVEKTDSQQQNVQLDILKDTDKKESELLEELPVEKKQENQIDNSNISSNDEVRNGAKVISHVTKEEMPRLELVTEDQKPSERNVKSTVSPFRRSSSTSYIGDNYRWKNTAYDAWGYPSGQCTSFVAFRLAETNGFSNVGYLGNAGNWGYSAKSRGAYVDMKPAVGAVAWFGPSAFGSDSTYGHVAWVAAIDRNYVIIEEYNYNWSKSYNRRRILANSVTGYIHFKDLATQPNTAVVEPTASNNQGQTSLASSGTFRFSERSPIKSEPKLSATDVAYYEPGMSVNYDRTLVADGHNWISYISHKGGRYYIAVGKVSQSSSNESKNQSSDKSDSISVTDTTIPASGNYVFKVRSNIKSEPKISSADLAYYDAGDSVNYDRVLEAEGYKWISYLSYQGNRRYIPIEKIGNSSTSSAPVNSESISKVNLPNSGSYTFTKQSYIKNEPRMNATTVAYYDAGSSVNYDKIVESEGHSWLSYISGSGVRRYIAIN